MSLPLTAAIQNGRPWLDRFTRLEYRKAFRAYMDQYGQDCLALIQNAQDPEALAEEVLGELEAGRKKLRFWNRGERIFDEKQTVIKYFAPMLLQQGDEAFAEQFRQAWSRRWPKDSYEHATFEQLNKSFVNVIFILFGYYVVILLQVITRLIVLEKID